MRRFLATIVLLAATALSSGVPAQASTTPDPDPIGVCVTRTDTGEVICVIVWP